MVKKESEVDLSSVLLSQNTAAYTLYYTNNFQKFCLLSNKYVKDINVAEEIVQEIFIKLWTGEFDLTGVSSYNSYIAKTVINQSLNWLKRQKSISHHHAKIASSSLLDYQENLIEEQELTVLIFKEIDKLPAQCQKIFKLSRFEGLKYREIALMLNISEKTVESHISSALKSLRAKFFDENSSKKYKNFNIYTVLFI